MGLLPEGNTMENMYFVQCMIDLLAEFCFVSSRQAHQRKFMPHFDNAPIGKTKSALDHLEACGFSRMDNAAYSRDVAPCDFFWCTGYFGGHFRCFPCISFCTMGTQARDMLPHRRIHLVNTLILHIYYSCRATMCREA
jgi:hypothetical protein